MAANFLHFTEIPFQNTSNEMDIDYNDGVNSKYNITDINNDDFSKLNYSDDVPIWGIRPSLEVSALSLAIGIIIFFGVIGNSALIYLILRYRALRKSPVNLFILNMSIADLLTTLFCPWMALVTYINQNYVLGPFLCKMEAFFKVGFFLVSVLSLVTMSVERFIATVSPFKRRLSTNSAYIIMIFIWVFAITVSSPLAVWRVMHVRQWHDYLEKWCAETHTEVSKYYWISLLVIIVYIPLLVMVVVYSVILCQLNKFENKNIGDSPLKKRHRRTLLWMLLLYLLITGGCWLPLQIVIYYRKFKQGTGPVQTWYNDLCFASQATATLHAAINPIVSFFQTFRHWVPKLLFWKKDNSQNRVHPIGRDVMQWEMQIARPSLASDSNNQNKININGVNGQNLSSNTDNTTTSFTKQILMNRAPQIFLRDDT